MKIATFNVNGINGRLPILLRWLETSRPEVVCLQELKAPQEKFPQAALAKLGYGAIWRGQKSWNGVAILARDADPTETRRGLPGDPDDAHSRYIEATVRGIVVGCLYLPNGNPAPGPKFDYKLRWFERLIAHASELHAWGRNAGLRIDHLLLNHALAKRLLAAGVDREVRGWDKASDHAPVWIEIDDVREKRRPTR